jgi:hypothetical protein
MVIKASAAAGVRALVLDLASPEEVRREAAIARIAVIGDRAVPHILSAFRASRDRVARTAMLRALEPIADPRAGAVARDALAEGGDLAVAAAGVLRGLLTSGTGTTSSEALDALMGVLLDGNADRRARVATLEALETVPEVRDRVTAAVGRDERLLEIAKTRAGDRGAADALWTDALDGRLPDDPRALRTAVQEHGAAAPLGALHKLVDRLRTHESSVPDDRMADWRAVRGAVHQALALRTSRVALYDLREAIASSKPGLPISFLAAVQLIGDANCLEDIATAMSRTPPGETRWRAQLATAFRTVAAREKITRRHATMKRIQARWPDIVPELTGK